MPREGGTARSSRRRAGTQRLSRHLLARTGRSSRTPATHDENADVYVVPAAGGQPPAARPIIPGPTSPWPGLPTAKSVLFHSGRARRYRDLHQLYTVPVSGGFPTELPLPSGERGVVLARRRAARLRAVLPVAAGMEALPRRADRRRSGSRTFATPRVTKVPREGSNDKQPDVGRRHRAISSPTARGGDAIRVRHRRRRRTPGRSRTTTASTSSPPPPGPGAIVYDQLGALSPVRPRVRPDAARGRRHASPPTFPSSGRASRRSRPARSSTPPSRPPASASSSRRTARSSPRRRRRGTCAT